MHKVVQREDISNHRRLNARTEKTEHIRWKAFEERTEVSKEPRTVSCLNFFSLDIDIERWQIDESDENERILNKTHVMNCTDWHVIVNDYSVFFADWPWLQLLACCFVVRFGLFRRILYVIHALIEYLCVDRRKDMFFRSFELIEASYLTLVWPSR